MVEKEIWCLLMEEIKNPYGVAGLMGNLMAESSMNPMNATGKNPQMTNKDYVANVKEGRISANEFAHDGVAFGLAQWRYWSRKESLLNFVGANKIDDPLAQTRFLLFELKLYKSVWNTITGAKSVREASDAVMTGYEKPANVSESAKAKRAAYGQKYYNQFAEPEPVPAVKYVYTTVNNVNIRNGNGKSYEAIGRARLAGAKYEWVATSDNGWHAIKYNVPNMVAWVSGEFSKVE